MCDFLMDYIHENKEPFTFKKTQRRKGRKFLCTTIEKLLDEEKGRIQNAACGYCETHTIEIKDVIDQIKDKKRFIWFIIKKGDEE